DSEQAVLQRMGLDVEPLKGGCCGVAGSWGFEKGKYQISVDCGEQALLPAVRDASEEAVIVANGFSCKTQIQDETDRRALHLGQVIRMAQRAAVPDEKPEGEAYLSRPSAGAGRRAVRAGVVVAGAGIAALMARAATAPSRRGADPL
ncbi:MAG TPA: hypothetical protein VI452_00665, partial [Marmoricola sp.]